MKYSSIFIIVIFLFTNTLFAQSETKISYNNLERAIYFSPGLGKPFLHNYMNNEKRYTGFLNLGFAFSYQKWPHLYSVSTQPVLYFRIGPKVLSEDFIQAIFETNFLYTYLINFPKNSKSYIGIGSGVSILPILKNGKTTGDESVSDEFIFRPGIPFEFRFGSSDIPKKIGKIDFTLFLNINSESTFYGIRLRINIGSKF